MTLSGYILEKFNRMEGAYTCHRLVEEAKALNMQLDIVGIHDTCVSDGIVVNTAGPLERRDFVINRYKWGRVKDAVNALVKRAYNPLGPYNVYINKYEQVKSLRSEAFELPAYLLSTSAFPYARLVAALGSPFVAKGLESSMGREVRLIRSEDEYRTLQQQFPMDKEWLFEHFVAHSYGRDLRLFSIRGEAVACMMRQSAGDFRANVALGAHVEAVPIDETLQQVAADIYRQTQLDFLGIDLLFGESGYYLCEINVMPGLQGIESATGVNIAKRIMWMIKEDFENE